MVDLLKFVKFPVYLGLINVGLVLTFAIIYFILIRNDLNSFNGLDENSSFIDVLYFTTTTQTTIGYGDITPKSKLARSIVIVQQLLIVVAALISIEIIDETSA
jgi:hypothetical protein